MRPSSLTAAWLAVLAACSAPIPAPPRDLVLAVGDATIRVEGFTTGDFTLTEAEVRAWVGGAAEAVAAYYGRFPVPALELVLVAEEGAQVGNGVTRPLAAGAEIVLGLGRRADAAALRADWVLVHEMVHTALPTLPPAHRWLEEGLATYVEGVVRTRAGMRPEVEFWADFVAMAPEGLPGPASGGLDGTQEWGRVYWGGATFCLLLDLAIRERTSDARSLGTALRAVHARLGDLRREATLAEVLAAMDAAVGAPVASELHAEHGARARSVDLAALWRELGVVTAGSVTSLLDAGPRAARRRAITRRGT